MFLNVGFGFDYAAKLAKLSRGEPRTHKPLDDFLNLYYLVKEFHNRINRPKISDLISKHWPKAPGTTFSSNVGDSALEVAIKFIEMIHNTAEITRSDAATASGMMGNRLSEMPLTNQVVGCWRELFIEQLSTCILPQLPAWPMWEILRDEQRLHSLMRDEYERANNPDLPHVMALNPEHLRAAVKEELASPGAPIDTPQIQALIKKELAKLGTSKLDDDAVVRVYKSIGSLRKTAELLTENTSKIWTKDSVRRAINRKGGTTAVMNTESSQSIIR